MVDPRYEIKLRDLERRILTQPGFLEPTVRWAAFEAHDVPGEVAVFVEKVRRHAYRVTDDEVADLLSLGWSQDQLFELTISAALGSATERLHAGLRALETGTEHAANKS
jgi:alkylhydroperoxidase family enzyme